MKPTNVDFYFDFGSPNAWLAHALLPKIAERSNIQFHYRPILLGGIFQLTGNQPPKQAFAQVPSKVKWFRREMTRFVQRHRIPFVFNPHFPVNTLKVMRGAVLFQDSPQFMPYVEACFRHMWVDPKDLGDEATLRQALEDSGFDSEGLLRGIADPEIKSALLEATQSAVARGVFGAPTFLVDDELYFGKEQLLELEVDVRVAASRSGEQIPCLG